MSRFNFTQPSNDQVCGCGRHHGVGEWSPERRAAVYAGMRLRLANYFAPHMRQYLESWEDEHGTMRIEKRQIGVTTGAFGNPKGEPLSAYFPADAECGQPKNRTWYQEETF